MLAFPDDGQIRFRKLRDAGSVLNATLTFVRQNARELATSYLALVAPVALASGLSFALYFRQFGDIFADPEALASGDFSMFGPSYFVAILLSMLGAALSQAAGAGYVRLYRQGRAGTISAGDLWDESRGLLLPFLGLPLLFAIVMMLAAVINAIPCLGTIAWVGFVIWSLPYYVVTLAARAIDSDSVGEAWARARMLVKGSWGFAAGAILLSMLILIVVSFGFMMIMSTVMGIVMAGTMADDPAAMMSWMGAIYAPLQVVSYALYVIIIVAAFFVHGRLAEELDGTSVRDDLDTLADAGFDRQSQWTPGVPPSTPPASTPPTTSRPPASPTDGRPTDPGTPEESPTDRPGGFRGGGFGA